MVDHESKLIKLKRKKVAGKKEPTFGFSLKRHERVDGQIINVVCDCKDFAVKKGLKNNQQLIQINMQSVEGLSLPEMVALVKNTPEKITLLTQPLDPEILLELQSNAASKAASKAASPTNSRTNSEITETQKSKSTSSVREIRESSSSTKNSSRTASLLKTGKIIKLKKDQGSFGFSVTENETEKKMILTDIAKNGLAEHAGVEAGDVILAVNGEKVTPEMSLKDVVRLIRSENESGWLVLTLNEWVADSEKVNNDASNDEVVKSAVLQEQVQEQTKVYNSTMEDNNSIKNVDAFEPVIEVVEKVESAVETVAETVQETVVETVAETVEKTVAETVAETIHETVIENVTETVAESETIDIQITVPKLNSTSDTDGVKSITIHKSETTGTFGFTLCNIKNHKQIVDDVDPELAGKDGLKKGDAIVKINGEEVHDKSQQDIVDMIREISKTEDQLVLGLIESAEFDTYSETMSIRSEVQSLRGVPEVEGQAEGQVADAKSESGDTIIEEPESLKVIEEVIAVETASKAIEQTIGNVVNNGRKICINKSADESCGFTAKVSTNNTICIDRVVEASPAHVAGLLIGDEVVGFSDLEKFIDYVKEDGTFVEFNVTHVDNYIASETVSMVSTIRDDLDVEIPAVMINSEVTAVREERAPTGLSMAPENLALPASAAVSRKNTFKEIPDFDDKKGVAFTLGTAVAQKAASRPTSVSSIGKHEEVHEIDRVFAQLDTVLKTAEEADKPAIDPIQSSYLGLKPIEDDMRSILDLELDGEEIQMPKIGKLLNRWKEREDKNFNGQRMASGSISGRSSMKRVQIKSATKTFKPSFGTANGNMIIMENEEE